MTPKAVDGDSVTDKKDPSNQVMDESRTDGRKGTQREHVQDGFKTMEGKENDANIQHEGANLGPSPDPENATKQTNDDEVLSEVRNGS